PGRGPGLALGLEFVDEVVVLPSDLFREVAQTAEGAARPQAQDAEGGGDHDFLDLIVRVRDALKHFQPAQSGLTAVERERTARRGGEGAAREAGQRPAASLRFAFVVTGLCCG